MDSSIHFLPTLWFFHHSTCHLCYKTVSSIKLKFQPKYFHCQTTMCPTVMPLVVELLTSLSFNCNRLSYFPSAATAYSSSLQLQPLISLPSAATAYSSSLQLQPLIPLPSAAMVGYIFNLCDIK